MKCNICHKRKCQCGSVETLKMLNKPTPKENINILKTCLEPIIETVAKRQNKLGELFWKMSDKGLSLEAGEAANNIIDMEKNKRALEIIGRNI